MFLIGLLLSGTLLWLMAQLWLKSLFLTPRFYLCGGALVGLLLISFFVPIIFPIVKIVLLLFTALLIIDIFFLFVVRKKPEAQRFIAERLSNSDINPVFITVKNNYTFTVMMRIVEELPMQFQERDHLFKSNFLAGQNKRFQYQLRPVVRGEYHFGNILLFISSLLCFIERRYTIECEQMVPVYPSFLQLRKYDLIAKSAQNQEIGSKRLRKIGHSMEFEQIKEYVLGDDIRNINWKATARKGDLMINKYTDERSQQVYCVIDKGRLMKMPFDELSLLDYAINASLMLCNVCIHRQDRFGLLTFSNKMGTFLAADKKAGQLEAVLQTLYNQTTNFLESDYEMLYMRLRASVKQRSLLVLFTNFESLSGLQRQLPYLKQIAKYHLLMVVFFENTELKKLTETRAADLEGVYVNTIAEKFAYEKRIIIKELQKNGILSILTTPQTVTINTINKYLELKSRQAI